MYYILSVIFFFLAFPSHLPPIISPPSLLSPTFSLLSLFSPYSSTSFFPHTPLSSHLCCPLCPSSLNLPPSCHFINYSVFALTPLLSSNLSSFTYGLVQPSPDLPVCLFLFFFFCFILPPSFSYPLPLLPHPPFPLVLSPASFIDY